MYFKKEIDSRRKIRYARSNREKEKDTVGVGREQRDRRRVREGRAELGGNRLVGEKRHPEKLMLWVSIAIHREDRNKGFGIMEERYKWNFGEQMRILVRET